MFQANMIKGAVWGRYPQTLNFMGSIIKTILDVPQLNEGAGFALRNVMANHYVMLTGRNAMNSAALASIFEMAAAFEMGDAVGPFERQQLPGPGLPGFERQQHCL